MWQALLVVVYHRQMCELRNHQSEEDLNSSHRFRPSTNSILKNIKFEISFSHHFNPMNSTTSLSLIIGLTALFFSGVLLLSPCQASSSSTSTPKTLLFSILSPPVDNAAYGNFVPAVSTASEARRRSYRVAWMSGLHYKDSLEKILKKKRREDEPWTWSDNDLFFHTRTKPTLFSLPHFLHDWFFESKLGNSQKGNSTFDATANTEIPAVIPKLLGTRFVGDL